MKITVDSLETLPAAAAEFLRIAGPARVFAFRAPMGAGKTTFISALCKALGASDDVASPTFSILNEYRSDSGENIYHFDFYRLSSAAEAFDIGVDDYFYSGRYCFLEWPEIVENMLPEDTVFVDITVDEATDQRILSSEQL